MLYDAHAHLDLIDVESLPKLIGNAKKNNVKYIITQSVSIDSFKNNLKIYEKYPEILKLSIGLYPEETLKEEDFVEMKKLIAKNKKEIFAMGEIGMDFSGEKPDKDLQKRIFVKQLNLAQELNLPVSIHTRKAEKEVIEILRNYPNLKKILHCFSGNFKLIKEAKEIGCYFSIPTNVVRSQHFQKMLEVLPKEIILTETDSPYLSPHANTTNEPSFIVETIKMISLIWKEPVEKVELKLENNFKQVYGIK